MSEASSQQIKADFQAAASTIKCELVDQYVTLVVRNDWSSGCHWYSQYKEPQEGSSKTKLPKKIRPLLDKCRGPMCEHVKGFRERLMEEAKAKEQRSAAS